MACALHVRLISASCERQVREARRLCAATEARLQALQAQQGESSQAARLSGACKAGSAEGAEPQGRLASSSSAAGSHNLSYLRQVVERYILMDDGEETDALFQVLLVLMHMPCTRHYLHLHLPYAPSMTLSHDPAMPLSFPLLSYLPCIRYIPCVNHMCMCVKLPTLHLVYTR